MRIYCVGGAVRDELLGLPVHDRDWVVVGATPAMLEAQGFRPVGRDFPVFLHPETHEEHALARTERKTGPGYRGFVVHYDPEVTLEDDLKRRDLTVNAMARGRDGTLIDPWGGRQDLQDRILRHVSEAFAEDPVRILRVARFAARFHEFRVAPETMALMRAMVANGEVDHLVPERVWQEFARGLMEAHPTRMIEVLQECGALARLLPELDACWSEASATTLRAAAQAGAPLPVRFALLVRDAAEEAASGGAETQDARVEAIAARLRAPVECRELARLFVREQAALEAATRLDPTQLVGLVERLDALRRPERMEQVLEASRLRCPDAPLDRVRLAASAARSVDAGAVAKGGPKATIRELVHAARVSAVEESLREAAPPASRSATAGSSK
jgi:tRNA nucleotidyltransferase (CCA-adding enzyme)